jgi:hypothetical protein
MIAHMDLCEKMGHTALLAVLQLSEQFRANAWSTLFMGHERKLG